MSEITNQSFIRGAGSSIQVMPTELEPAYQLEEQKELSEALVETASIPDPEKAGEDFKGLMPQWMLDMGESYYWQEQFNGSSGEMGEYEASVAKTAAQEEAFVQAIQSAGSFGALKDLMNQPGNIWMSAEGNIGVDAGSILNALNHFSPNGNAQQKQSEEASEYGILSQGVNTYQNNGSGQMTFEQEINKEGDNYLSDEGDIGNFIAQISQGFSSIQG